MTLSCEQVLAVIPGCASRRRPGIQTQSADLWIPGSREDARPGTTRVLRSVRRHEDRQPEPGEVVQRLIDADQPPEPLMVHRHVESGDAKALGAVDDEV